MTNSRVITGYRYSASPNSYSFAISGLSHQEPEIRNGAVLLPPWAAPFSGIFAGNAACAPIVSARGVDDVLVSNDI